MKIVSLLFLLLAGLAHAAPVNLGQIVSTGASKNNLTTASTFTMPLGGNSIQCNADVFLAWGTGNGVTATSSGMSIPAGMEKVFTVKPKQDVVAVIPASGSVTCTVWYLSGETVYYAARGGGVTSPCGVIESCASVGYEVTASSGTGIQFDAALQDAVDLGPGIKNSIGTNEAGEILMGTNGTIMRVGDATTIESGQATFTNGAVNFNNSLLRDNITGYLQIASRFEIQSQTLGSCPRASGTVPLVYVTGTGGSSSGVWSRLCACISDGSGNHVWRNVLAGTNGTNTTCPDWTPS